MSLSLVDSWRFKDCRQSLCTLVGTSLSPTCRKLPHDVSNDHALEHEEVRRRIGKTIQTLYSLSDRFQQAIFNAVGNLPWVELLCVRHVGWLGQIGGQLQWTMMIKHWRRLCGIIMQSTGHLHGKHWTMGDVWQNLHYKALEDGWTCGTLQLSSHSLTTATKTFANVDKSFGWVRLYADDLSTRWNLTFPRSPSHSHSPINRVAVKFLLKRTAPILSSLMWWVIPTLQLQVVPQAPPSPHSQSPQW